MKSGYMDRVIVSYAVVYINTSFVMTFPCFQTGQSPISCSKQWQIRKFQSTEYKMTFERGRSLHDSVPEKADELII